MLKSQGRGQSLHLAPHVGHRRIADRIVSMLTARSRASSRARRSTTRGRQPPCWATGLDRTPTRAGKPRPDRCRDEKPEAPARSRGFDLDLREKRGCRDDGGFRKRKEPPSAGRLSPRNPPGGRHDQARWLERSQLTVLSAANPVPGLIRPPKDRASNAVSSDFDICTEHVGAVPRCLLDVPLVSRQPASVAHGGYDWIGRPRHRLPIRPATVILTLSGGNQQKVMLARWLSQSCRLLVLDETLPGVSISRRGVISARRVRADSRRPRDAGLRRRTSTKRSRSPTGSSS